MAERSVPYDLQAERATLGAILLDAMAVERVADWLPAEAYYLQRHAWIYEAMLACYARREPPDLTTVATELRRHPDGDATRLEVVGGIAALAELINATSDPYRIEAYARAVEATATRRRLIEAGGQIACLGYREDADLETTLDEAETTLFAVSQRRASEAGMGVDLADAAGAWWSRVERLQNGEECAGVPTGWQSLDDRLLLRRGQFHILAARPGVGKSALALALSRAVGQRGDGVDYYSLEMDRMLMQDRLYAMEAGIDADRIQRGKLSDADLRRLAEAAGRATQWPIHLVDRFQLSHLGLRGYARRRAATARPALIIVDHLGLLPSPNAENRNAALGEITRGFVHLALELDVPIVALSQLNREVEKRSSKVPGLADLRDSGNLEQDAATVTFLYRPWLYDTTQHPGRMELHNAKNRNGATGWKVDLEFEPMTMQIRSTYEGVPGYESVAA